MVSCFFILAIFSSCSTTDLHEREDAYNALKAKKVTFEEMLVGIDCIDAADWNFVAYGSKACVDHKDI